MRQLHTRTAKFALQNTACARYLAVIETIGHPVPNPIVAKETKMFRSLVETVRHFNQYRAVYSQLSRMSSRELADIGLSRCDIEEVARGRRH